MDPQPGHRFEGFAPFPEHYYGLGFYLAKVTSRIGGNPWGIVLFLNGCTHGTDTGGHKTDLHCPADASSANIRGHGLPVLVEGRLLVT